jgi:hypothetical protein
MSDVVLTLSLLQIKDERSLLTLSLLQIEEDFV